MEQQTATSEVLKSSAVLTFDLDRFQALVETAARICRADKFANLYFFRTFSLSTPPRLCYSGACTASQPITFAPGREGVAGRVLLERKPVQIVDVLADPEYGLPEVQRLGQVVVPTSDAAASRGQRDRRASCQSHCR